MVPVYTYHHWKNMTNVVYTFIKYNLIHCVQTVLNSNCWKKTLFTLKPFSITNGFDAINLYQWLRHQESLMNQTQCGVLKCNTVFRNESISFAIICVKPFHHFHKTWSTVFQASDQPTDIYNSCDSLKKNCRQTDHCFETEGN